MTNNRNLNSLIFTVVVLFAVLFGGIRQESPAEVTFEPTREMTSLVATVQATTEEVHNSLEPIKEDFVIEAPLISATSALVKDLFNNEPMYSHNMYQQWPVASITKLLTAVVALDKIPEDDMITVSQDAVYTEGVAGFLGIGHSYARDELLKSLLVYSSNDAASALAEHFNTIIRAKDAGENNYFIDEMNRKASSLGMYNTRFFDPHGLTPLNQSMISDLEKLIHHIYNIRPEILEITREVDGNTHPFVKNENFIGGKTGFIDEANGNLISLFNYQGRPLLIIVLGSEDRQADTQILYDKFTSR